MPDRNAGKKHWAPNDVMLDFWDQLADQPEKQDMRYVLTLLLVRRRVFRWRRRSATRQGRQLLVVYCPRREATYEVPAVDAGAGADRQIQEELAALAAVAAE